MFARGVLKRVAGDMNASRVLDVVYRAGRNENMNFLLK